MRFLAPVIMGLFLAGCGNRTLDLPGQASELMAQIRESRDAADLHRRLRSMGIILIRVAGDDGLAGPWNHMESDRFMMFWRIYTEAPIQGKTALREFRVKPAPKGLPRALLLDEPPGLATLARDGDTLAQKGRWREALRAYEKAQNSAPTLPLLHARIGDCRLALGEYSRALNCFTRSISMGGNNPELFSRIGETMERAGKKWDAEDAFGKSAGLDPDNAVRWIRLASCLLGHGKRAPARKALARALSLDPENTEAKALGTRMEGKR